MNDCKHEWAVIGVGDVDDNVIELEGWLDLRCTHCRQLARLPQPDYCQLWQITRAWLHGEEAYWRGDEGDLVDIQHWTPAIDDDPNDHPGVECAHEWTVQAVTHDPSAERDLIELSCDHCGAWACVHDVTSEEAATIGKMWNDGLRVNWSDDARVSFSAIPPADDDNGGMVADLVNALDLGLEVESDEDIPF